MKRITKEVKAIADAHIRAKANGIFDEPTTTEKDEFLAQIRNGKTSKVLLQKIEMKFCSITSLLSSNILDYNSPAYRSQVYRGFKVVLQ